MLSVLETIFDLLLVLSTSKWGWLGIAAGSACSYLIWRIAEGHASRPIAAAGAFAVVFMACFWQELSKK